MKVQYQFTASGVGEGMLTVMASGKRLDKALKRQGRSLKSLIDSATGRGTDACSILVDLAQSIDTEAGDKIVRKAAFSGGRLHRRVAIDVGVSIKLTRKTYPWLIESVVHEVIDQALMSMRGVIDEVLDAPVAKKAVPIDIDPEKIRQEPAASGLFDAFQNNENPPVELEKALARLFFSVWETAQTMNNAKGPLD